MSTASLTNLLEYLYGTLTPSNMRWVAAHLTEYANSQEQQEPMKRYTMEDINAMLDQSEADITSGRTVSHEESMGRWKEKLARKIQDKELAEAV